MTNEYRCTVCSATIKPGETLYCEDGPCPMEQVFVARALPADVCDAFEVMSLDPRESISKPAAAAHQWDDVGERRVKCGAKDWTPGAFWRTYSQITLGEASVIFRYSLMRRTVEPYSPTIESAQRRPRPSRNQRSGSVGRARRYRGATPITVSIP